MPLLLSIYATFGVIDKISKFYNTLLDNKIKTNDIRKQKDVSGKNVRIFEEQKLENDAQIKLLEKQIRELKSDKRKMAEENKILISSIVELTHYIKGMPNQNIKTDLLYSKTVFENQKNSNEENSQDEN
jgi:hypothetical protein